jgi:hypothetical protein
VHIVSRFSIIALPAYSLYMLWLGSAHACSAVNELFDYD